MSQLRLIGNRLLVIQLPQKVITESGILLVDRYQDDRMRWRVVQVGPKVKDIKSGDCILANLNNILYEWTDGYKIVDANDAMAVWNDQPTPDNSIAVPESRS